MTSRPPSPEGHVAYRRRGGLPRVVVVGAGLAGLRCAERLAGSVDLILVESRERVGGRCWSSLGWSDGQVGEHGGEFIEEGQEHLLALITELGLATESRQAGPRAGRLRIAGQLRDPAEVRGLPIVLRELERDLRRVGPVDWRSASTDLRDLDAMSAEEWLEEHVDGGCASDLGACLATTVTLVLGLAPRQLSAIALHHMWLGLPDPDSRGPGFRFGHDVETEQGTAPEYGDVNAASVIDVLHVAGGNDQVALALAERLPASALRLASPVTAVDRERGGRYRVSIAGQPDLRGIDRVVLTAPLPLLGSMDLSGAGLSRRRHSAIAEIPMATHSKLTLQVDRPLSLIEEWPGYALTDHPTAVVWDSSRGQPGDAGLLTIFTPDRKFASRVGGHGTPDAESLARAYTLIEQLIPGLRAHCNGVAWLDSWSDDPWAQGSYAGFAPGQFSQFAGFLGMPEEGIHFAGEHTSLASQGFLDGAVASGERAAQEVLNALCLTSRA